MRVGNWASAPHHRSQLTLFSPSLDDMIPPGHQIRGLEQLVQLFDWSDWEAGYDGHRGQPPIHPSLIAGAILYGLKEGIRSSRKLEDATKMRIDFMWFLNGRVIDHSTFAAFRTRFGSELRDLFKQLAVLAINRAVEIELALEIPNQRQGKARLGFLQMRPMAVAPDEHRLEPDDLEGPDVVVAARHALGNGVRDDIRDVVFVDPERFDASITPAIAAEVESVDRSLAGAPYLLVGPGRWGTSDPWFGIPVTWSQIAGARVIAEATVGDVGVTMRSQDSKALRKSCRMRVRTLRALR